MIGDNIDILSQLLMRLLFQGMHTATICAGLWCRVGFGAFMGTDLQSVNIFFKMGFRWMLGLFCNTAYPNSQFWPA